MKKLLLFLLSALVILAPQSFAQESISLGVFPPILQIEAEPPASINSNISIQNLSDQSASYTIELVPFKDSGELTGRPQFVEPDRLYKELFTKVQVMDNNHVIKEITLSPRQKKDLRLHVGLLRGDKNGDYYFTILFISKSSASDIKNPSLGARGGIATNVLLRVGPQDGPSGRVTEFSSPGFINKGPVSFNVKAQNTANSFTQVSGNIIIKNMFGQTIGQVDLLPVNVLANSERIIPSKTSKTLTDVLWNEGFLLGPYTAELSLAMSEKGPIIREKETFFAFPIEGLIGILIALGFIVFIVQRVRSKRI